MSRDGYSDWARPRGRRSRRAREEEYDPREPRDADRQGTEWPGYDAAGDYQGGADYPAAGGYAEDAGYQNGGRYDYGDSNGYGAGGQYGEGSYQDRGGYDQAGRYQEPAGYQAGYDDRGYGPPAGYDGRADQDPYGQADPRAAHTDPAAWTDPRHADPPYARGGDYAGYSGRASYPEPQEYPQSPDYGSAPGYGAPYAGDDRYDAARGYGQDANYGADTGYDDYGRPRGSGAERSPGSGGYGQISDSGGHRRYSAEEYEQVQTGRSGSHRGGGSASGIDADAERHSGFFSGFGADDHHYGRKSGRRGGGGRGGRGGGGAGGGRARGRAAGTIALLVIFAVIVGLGGGGYYIYHSFSSRHTDWTGSNGYGSVVVTVKTGQGYDAIAPELVSKGVIAAADPWATYVLSKPANLQPGEYKLHLHMGVAQAYALLNSPKARVTLTVLIPDGVRYTKFLKEMAKQSGIPLTQFQAAIKETSKLGLPAYAHGNPEGYLFPATYDIAPGESALQILQAAAAKFTAEAAQLNLAAGARRTGFTEAHLVIIASLLEGEVSPQYYADVARVIDNRLQINKALQLDSTIAYATGIYSFNYTNAQLHFPSPYNTNLHVGLPPGPINSPSAAALKAAMNPAPASNNWLYFITINKQGLTKFTNSYSQFLQWSAEATHNGV